LLLLLLLLYVKGIMCVGVEVVVNVC